MQPVWLSACTTVSALGRGTTAAVAALRQGRSGLQSYDFDDGSLTTWIGRVAGLEDEPVTGPLAAYDCRNHRLARLALEQDGFRAAVAAAVARYGAARIGTFIGTSTSGILATEDAYRHRPTPTSPLATTLSFRHSHDVFAATDFCRQYLHLAGPALGLSTACSSSAKAFATAARYLAAGLIDAAVVGGVDSLCLTTLYGFTALALMASSPCQPWDAARVGLNIGEAAAFALLERPRPAAAGEVALLGYGESSDAYHMSTPHPDGAGAQVAMQAALDWAGLPAAAVGYINLHGTATPANDAAEDRAVRAVFPDAPPCSSTKGWTGHTLGAAGALEAVLTCLCLREGLLPANLNLHTPDPALRLPVLRQNEARAVDVALSNSFGFGGTNCSLLFGRLS